MIQSPDKLARSGTDGMVPKASFDSNIPREEAMSQFTTQFEQKFYSAALVSIFKNQTDHPGLYLLTLDIGQKNYEDLTCIQVRPLNSEPKVERALRALGASGSELVKLSSNPERCPTFYTFLSELVDLEVSFSSLNWIDNLNLPRQEKTLDVKSFSSQSVLNVLETLKSLCQSGDLANQSFQAHILDICLSMPLLHIRNYSIASSLLYQRHKSATDTTIGTTQLSSNLLQILLKPYSNGRFSSIYLNDCPAGSTLKYRIIDAACGPLLRQPATKLQIIVATGAGFAPVRCLLQRLIATQSECGISLFLGLKPADISLVTDLLTEATKARVLDKWEIVPSNAAKSRVYDEFRKDDIGEMVKRKLVDEEGTIFVCAGPQAAKETKEMIEQVIGVSVESSLGSRWVEEVF